MSYVQGTKVWVVGTFTDPVSGVQEDPDDVIVTIYPPDDADVVVLDLEGMGVTKIEDGKFQAMIDTSSAPGIWEYTFEGTGDEAVVKRRSLRVKPRPT